MIVLGIDPGSITTGWALLEVSGNKVSYLKSGILKFDTKKEFLNRTLEMKVKLRDLIKDLNPDEISLESLIFVKSPTALIKLAQTRGIIISELVEKYENKIFEYSPNLVKSSTTGHGHAGKESVRKFLDMALGKIDYQTHDESDAAAIAFCHAMNRGHKKLATTKRTNAKGLSGSLAHKIG